jgi:hypothetical protein
MKLTKESKIFESIRKIAYFNAENFLNARMLTKWADIGRPLT